MSERLAAARQVGWGGVATAKAGGGDSSSPTPGPAELGEWAGWLAGRPSPPAGRGSARKARPVGLAAAKQQQSSQDSS